MSEVAYLADTHIILWSLSNSPRLGNRHRQILASGATVYASAVSVWEIAIKRAAGKLSAPPDLANLLPRMRFRPLNINFAHAEAVAGLPPHHTDPFDRLLVAQAKLEALTILTVDRHMARYDVTVL
jgi:PIN domain nuclease of toxin-antitoxin system